jgi:death-on-curing protein
MNWHSVDIEIVYQIHTEIISRAKTTASIRDFSLLHSALERPKATYQGKDLYPTIFLKAAALLQSLCQNHPFTDGNKRTSWAVTHKFLWDSDYHLKANKDEIVNFMLSLDKRKPDLKTISSWLKSHCSYPK